MALILSIETSTSVCSSALHQDGELLAFRETTVPQSAASELAVQIQHLLEESHLTSGSLEAVAVSSGPGSYTGLRIGAATAKGICFGCNIPLISINSLLVLAAQIPIDSGRQLLCPMIDARRMEVYCALFDPSLQMVEATQARVISSDSYAERLEQSEIVFFGNGASKCRDVIRHPHAIFIDGYHPSASPMGPLAEVKLRNGEWEDLDSFEPAYLKDFVAKTKTT